MLPNATVVIGLTQKGFRPGHEPGSVDKSVGFMPSTGRSALLCTVYTAILTLIFSMDYFTYLFLTTAYTVNRTSITAR